MEKVLAAAAIVQWVKAPALTKNWELVGPSLHFCPGLASLGVYQTLHISIICTSKTLLWLLLPDGEGAALTLLSPTNRHGTGEARAQSSPLPFTSLPHLSLRGKELFNLKFTQNYFQKGTLHNCCHPRFQNTLLQKWYYTIAKASISLESIFIYCSSLMNFQLIFL